MFVIVLSKSFGYAPAAVMDKMIISPIISSSRIRQTECSAARWQSVFYSKNVNAESCWNPHGTYHCGLFTKTSEDMELVINIDISAIPIKDQ